MMKKILAVVVSMVMLLSVGAVCANAYAYDFIPAGDIEIQWYEYAYDEIEIDGSLYDWYRLGVQSYDLTGNMADWVNAGAAPADDFGMTAMFLADPYYLYIGLEIRDNEFSKVEYNDAAGIGTYKGDAIQFGIDFGGMQADFMEIDPEFLTGLAAMNSFFSFASRDLTGECTVVAQHTGIYQDGPLDRAMFADDVFAYSSEMLDGSGNVVGWYAEFRISWDAMFRNAAEKVWLEDEVYYGVYSPLEVSMLLCYLDMDRYTTCVPSYSHAYATYASLADAYAGGDHTPLTNGLNLYLPYEEGRWVSIGDDRFLQGEDIWTDYPETEPGTDYPGIDYPDYPETEPDTDYPDYPDYPDDELPDIDGFDKIVCPACGYVFYMPSSDGDILGGDDAVEPDYDYDYDYDYGYDDDYDYGNDYDSADTYMPEDEDLGITDTEEVSCPMCGYMIRLDDVISDGETADDELDKDDGKADKDDDDDEDRTKPVYTYPPVEDDDDADDEEDNVLLIGCAGVIGASAATVVIVAAAAAVALRKKD